MTYTIQCITNNKINEKHRFFTPIERQPPPSHCSYISWDVWNEREECVFHNNKTSPLVILDVWNEREECVFHNSQTSPLVILDVWNEREECVFHNNQTSTLVIFKKNIKKEVTHRGCKVVE